MFKRSLALAAAVCMALPSASFAAAASDPQPDLEAFAKAVAADGMTCPLGPQSLMLRENSADRWVIEFRCDGGVDDGRLGVFPKKKGGAQIIYNCAKAKLAGMACANTKESVGYPSLNADIKRLDYASECKVSETRLMGISPNKKTVYLEVKCNETNLPGQVLQYDAATLKASVLVSCDEAGSLGGGCRIPGAVKNPKALSGNGMNSALSGQSSTSIGGPPDGSVMTRGMTTF